MIGSAVGLRAYHFCLISALLLGIDIIDQFLGNFQSAAYYGQNCPRNMTRREFHTVNLLFSGVGAVSQGGHAGLGIIQRT